MADVRAPSTEDEADACGSPSSLEAFVSLGLRFTKTRAVDGGVRVRAGQTVAVSYTCRLGSAEGRVLDASDEGAPLSVRAGRAAVVPGWDLALLRMRVGEEAALELPPSLAYGAKGNAKVPPASRLHFLLEVVSVVEGADDRLLDAAATADADALRLALRDGARANAADARKGLSALHMAAGAGDGAELVAEIWGRCRGDVGEM